MYPKLRNMTYALSLSIITALKGTNFYIIIFMKPCNLLLSENLTFILLFAITAAGIVLCAGPKLFPRHHP